MIYEELRRWRRYCPRNNSACKDTYHFHNVLYVMLRFFVCLIVHLRDARELKIELLGIVFILVPQIRLELYCCFNTFKAVFNVGNSFLLFECSNLLAFRCQLVVGQCQRC